MRIKHAWDIWHNPNTPGHIPLIEVPTLAVPEHAKSAYASLYVDSESPCLIASYWIDTTLQIIPAGTYTDSTGTIIT